MTLPAQTPTITVAANGSTYTFAYNFEVPFQDGGSTPAVLVYTKLGPNDPVLLDPATYTIAGVGNVSGGTVTYPLLGPPLTIDYNVIITRNLAYTQGQQFNNTGFDPRAIEVGLDRLGMQIQQLESGGTGGGTVVSGVSTVNGRSGAVTLFGSDVTGALGYVPVNKAGDTMGGPLLTQPANSASAGLVLGVGSTPTGPADGSIWNEAGGLFGRTGGATYNLTGGGGAVASVNGHTGVVVLAAADVGAIATTARGAVNGVASLDSGGKVPSGQLNLHTPVYFTAANQAAMLALSSAVVGDYCVRTDNGNTYVLTALPPATLGNWFLFSAGGGVTTVNGASGAVTVTPSNIGSVKSLKEYGAVCDGVTDDLAAWNALATAVNAGTVTAIFVPGISAVSAAPTTFTKGMSLFSIGPRLGGIKKLGGGDVPLLQFSGLTETDFVCIIDFGFISKEANTAQALKIAWVAGGIYRPSLVMRNVEVRGASSIYGFNRGIELINCIGGSFTEIFVGGYQTGSYPSSNLLALWGWWVHATTGTYSVDLMWSKCKVQAFQIGFKGTNHLEGFSWHQCVHVFLGTGWDIQISDASGAPYFSWVDCQTECLTGSFYLSAVAQIAIADCLLYRSASSAGSDNMIHIVNSQMIDIHDSDLLDLGGPGISNIVLVEDSLDARVHDNYINGWTGAGVWFLGTTTRADEYRNQYVNPRGSSFFTYYNSASAPNNLTNTGSQRKLTFVTATIDATNLAAQNTTPATLTTTPTTMVTQSFPVYVGERIRVSIYGYVTWAGTDLAIAARVRETNHKPGTGSPYTILQFAADKNHAIRTYPLSAYSGFGEVYVDQEWTFDIVANAYGSQVAAISLDLWTNQNTAAFQYAQIRVQKL